MGIYSRNATALIILAALCISSASAATRKNVDLPSRSSVVNSGGASFSTPNGEAAFYGQDYVDTHSAGNRFNVNDNPGGTGARQKVTVKPVVVVDPKTVAKRAVDGIKAASKANLGSAALGVAMSAVMAAVDAVMDPDNNTIKIPSATDPSTDPSDFYWTIGYPGIVNTKFTSPTAACTAYTQQPPNAGVTTQPKPTNDPEVWDCNFRYGDRVIDSWVATRIGTSCSGSYNSSTGECLVSSGMRDATDSDFSDMEKWAADQDSDFIRDLLKESCAGSTAPARCVEELSKWGNMQGPATGVGPAQTTTTTTKNPDGTTSQTSTTTQNHYSYSFGPTYYNYSTTTKQTTTNADGSVSESESSDGGLPADDETPQDEEYTYQDSDFPEVEPFYEQKYSDGLKGVWNEVSARLDSSAFMQFLQGFVPSFSGSCPAFGLSFNIASWASYGTVQFSSICYVLDFVKSIILITALFTFRAITFGG